MAAEKRTTKTKAELEKLKKLAYHLFFNSDKTQVEIADIVGVSPQTMNKWVGDDKWAELKALEKVSRGATIKRIHDRIFKLSESEDPRAADDASKWASVLEKIENKKVTVPNMANTFKEFDTWLFGVDSELAKQVAKHQYEFLLSKI